MATRTRFCLPATRASPGAPHLLGRLLALLDKARQRYRLAELDDRLLRDIGLTRSEAREEARKPFWRGVRRE